ncbi:sugar-binding protein [Sphingobacterium phlebotomi]|nr:sugar-binding protein [Sphingobacterium phlebotomi]
MRWNKGLLKMSVLLTAPFCLLAACEKSTNPQEQEEPKIEEPKENDSENSGTDLEITSIEQLNQGEVDINSHADFTSRSSLKMNYRSYIGIGKTGLGVDNPRYPRIKKLANGTYILFFHNAPQSIGASCDYAVSNDLVTWTSKGKIYQNYEIVDSHGEDNERRFATCDALVLANGDILAVASFRANRGYREKPLDAGLVLRRSTDHGQTWSEPIEIYQGVNWEPYLLELPSGEIHCYFTDSDRTSDHGTDTGTAMVVSNDNGNNWTPSFGSDPYYVLRTKHIIDGGTYFNNQMPSVIKLNNSNELAAALEANIGGYHISFAYSGEDGQWEHLSKDEEGPADRNDLAFSGSAPYLRQFPSGETILSYNHNSRFHLKMGNAQARAFGENYSPSVFTGGYWGSLEVEDSHQIIGVMPNTGEKEITLAKFILNHTIHASQRTVNIDGDNTDWENTDEALFVGEKSQAQGTLRVAADNDSVYFLVEVLDHILTDEDHAMIYIAAADKDALDEGAYRLKVAHNGLKETSTYTNGWTSGSLGANAKSNFRGTLDNNFDRDHGYMVELAIPRSELTIKSEQILVNFAIQDNESGEDAVTRTNGTSTAKWISVMDL